MTGTSLVRSLVIIAGLFLLACGSKGPCPDTDSAAITKRTECSRECRQGGAAAAICLERCYGTAHNLNCDLCRLKIEKGTYKKNELAACVKHEDAQDE